MKAYCQTPTNPAVEAAGNDVDCLLCRDLGEPARVRDASARRVLHHRPEFASPELKP